MSIPALSFKEITSLEERKQRSNTLLSKYKDKIPVILEKSNRDKYLPIIGKNKLLVANDITVANVLQLLKKNLKINETISIYIMVSEKNIMLSGSQSMSYIYDSYKNTDGFLYLEYCSENVFG